MTGEGIVGRGRGGVKKGGSGGEETAGWQDGRTRHHTTRGAGVLARSRPPLPLLGPRASRPPPSAVERPGRYHQLTRAGRAPAAYATNPPEQRPPTQEFACR
jgi:hypothetical protein